MKGEAVLQDGRKLEIAYRDRDGSESRRTVWPFALGFFDRARVMVAWCELRQSFRHFRTDRILALTASDVRYPRRQRRLLCRSSGLAAGGILRHLRHVQGG
ncbi:helix-turn-helix transcriptional regulator [Azospirillum sp. B510]|uniref:helix-turn-helix transcriptional regulator n=1 Tax=Azospirillum sp. (strain B510) TaxID=137722 RepID=UPI0002EF2EB3|nr:WYL domain-containing protein [Azospirillum sp. B510]